MKVSSLPRKTFSFSNSIQQRLNGYALAASAAGVGLVALAQPAEARIVYTPAHERIKVNGGLFPIDLNHDGTADFVLSNYSNPSSGSQRILRVMPAPEPSANEIWGKGMTCYYPLSCAAALPKGTKIGSTGQFQQAPKVGLYMLVIDKEGSWGPWRTERSTDLSAYLGLKFVVKGKTHFGWARLRVAQEAFQIPATLTGYAYETIPNKPIIAGATKGQDVTVHSGTLGMLAAGRK